jgi:hypothetical protein
MTQRQKVDKDQARLAEVVAEAERLYDPQVLGHASATHMQRLHVRAAGFAGYSPGVGPGNTWDEVPGIHEGGPGVGTGPAPSVTPDGKALGFAALPFFSTTPKATGRGYGDVPGEAGRSPARSGWGVGSGKNK